MNNTHKSISILLLFTLILLIVFFNFQEKLKVDRAKLPKYVEEHKNFQKWITNHKNKDINLEADAFRLLEETEVYNTERLKLYPITDKFMFTRYQQILKAQDKITDKRISPDGKQFVNYEFDYRIGLSNTTFMPSDVWYLGVRGDRVIENKLLSCNVEANCIFDRAFFISDDVVVVSEVARDIDTDSTYTTCGIDQICSYIIKLNVMDIANNSNLIYQSPPFNMVLADKIEGF